MNEFAESITNALAPPVVKAINDLAALAGAHPVILFVAFSVGSILVLNRAGSAS